MNPKAVALLSGVVLAVATASSFANIVSEIGDAGDASATAQVVTGGFAVTSISGTFASPTDADVYKIHIGDPTLFTATGSGWPTDGLLFLFDSIGRGVVSIDDSCNQCGNYGTLTSTFVLSAGDYFLGVSLFDLVPRSTAGLIFPDTQFVDSGVQYGPTGPGGALPLSSWTVAGGGVPTTGGSYVLTLSGVSTVPERFVTTLPEPTTLALLCLAGLAATRRRKLN